MKRILLFLALSSTIIFTSCEGDPGPPGLDGSSILGQVFETTVNFQYDSGSNTYFTNSVDFPFTVYESDVVLVYHYEGQTDIGNGETADLWTQLPQSVFYLDNSGDVYQYNFNTTFISVQFTIEGNFDLTNIQTNFDPTRNQTFRVAVVPAEFAKTNPSMRDVLEMMKIDGSQIEKIQK